MHYPLNIALSQEVSCAIEVSCKIPKSCLNLGSIFGFPGGAVIKNQPVNTGNVSDSGSIPWSGRSPGEGNGNHSSILAWKIPWSEKPGVL